MPKHDWRKMVRSCLLGAAIFWVGSSGIGAHPQQPQGPTVSAEVRIVQRANKAKVAQVVTDFSDVVVWLVPLDKSGAAEDTVAAKTIPKLVQRDEMFEPHLLVIQAGSLVEFPNKDPFFHNVFSLFDGKRFDLGLYEAGTSKTVRFDRVGVSFIFCNIHENMNAIIVSVPSAYFAKTDAAGHLKIANVPNGRYEMHVWYERSSAEDLKNLDRNVTISESSRTLDPIQILYDPGLNLTHKNKYGQDYVPPASSPGSAYP